MKIIRWCFAAALVWVSALGADNSLAATPQELFRVFQDSIIGIVMGDSMTVLKYTSSQYTHGIIDQNRKDLVKYRDDVVVKKAFEAITGRPYDALLALSDREFAIVVIEKFVPATRTQEEKEQIVSAILGAVLEEPTIQEDKIILKINYQDGTGEQAFFVKENNSWRLDEIK